MNVAFFLVPKVDVAYLYEDQTLTEGLEKLKTHGYTAIPVLTRDNLYVGTISEGDFLWYLLEREKEGPADGEARIHDVMRPSRNAPVLITATVEELLNRAENQNFMPVVDDRNLFIGIVRRSEIIHYYTAEQRKR